MHNRSRDNPLHHRAVRVRRKDANFRPQLGYLLDRGKEISADELLQCGVQKFRGKDDVRVESEYPIGAAEPCADVETFGLVEILHSLNVEHANSGTVAGFGEVAAAIHVA